MRWLDRLLGRTPDDVEDAEALDELKVASKRVRRRTDRIIEEYRLAEQRLKEPRR